jgi:hypothetical protein
LVLRCSVCRNARGGRPQGQGTIGDLVRHNTARIAVGFAYNGFDVVLCFFIFFAYTFHIWNRKWK